MTLNKRISLAIITVCVLGGVALAQTPAPAPESAPAAPAAVPAPAAAPAAAPAPAAVAPAPAPAAPVAAPAPAPVAAPAAAAPAPAPAPAPAAAPARLTGLEAWTQLIGNTVAGKNSDGDAVFEYYEKDGTVKQMVDTDVASGKWSIANGKVCFEFPDEEDAECYKLTVEGDAATFTDDEGSGRRFQVLPGNPKKL